MIDRLNQIIQRLDAQDARLASSQSLHDQAYRSCKDVYLRDVSGLGESSSDNACAHPKARAADVENFMEIPSSRTTADAILLWPIFEGRYPPEHLIDTLFDTDSEESHDKCSSQSRNPSQGTAKPSIGRPTFREDKVKELMEGFIAHVHIKNPILDVETLRSYGRGVVEDGPGWDGGSCLVVRNFQLASPLSQGSFATSFYRINILSLTV